MQRNSAGLNLIPQTCERIYARKSARLIRLEFREIKFIALARIACNRPRQSIVNQPNRELNFNPAASFKFYPPRHARIAINLAHAPLRTRSARSFASTKSARTNAKFNCAALFAQNLSADFGAPDCSSLMSADQLIPSCKPRCARIDTNPRDLRA